MFDNKKREPKQTDWVYRSKAWELARSMALERDNYLCQQCLKQDLIIYADVVHHIIHLTEDITKAFELENLESLCHSCHNKEHPEKGGDIRKRNEPKRNVRVIKA